MDIEDMNEEQFREYLKTIPRKERKATEELRKANIKAKGIQAPKTKMVENDDGTVSEVQTVSDTKDANKVPDTLGGKIHNESGKKEGEKTTQTSYAESVINDIEEGEKPSKVGAKQIEEVWGGKIGDAQKEGNGEGENAETPVEGPSKNDKGTTVPETREVIKEVIKEVPVEKEVIKYVNNPDVLNKANLIRRGIWSDYSNGLFGDDDTKGIPYDKLTPEQKKRRNQALSLAWRYTFDNIGTMLWNIGSAFGRKDTYIDNEYAKLLRKQNENLVQNDTDLIKQQKDFEQRLSQSQQFAMMSPSEQEAYLTFLMLDPSANKDNLLSARNLEQFEKYKLEIETNAVKASYLENNKLQASISNLIKDLDVKDANVDKINAEIARLQVENKLTESQVEKIMLECEKQMKENKYIDALAVAQIVGSYVDDVEKLTQSVGNVVNAFKPSLNINKKTSTKTTRTSPKGTQSTTETTVNETTNKK